MNDNIQLYKGDCLKVMQELIDKGIKVDMILTDPPYGTTACKWDNVIPFEPMWECVNKLIKTNGTVCLFGSEPFSSMLRCSNLNMFKYDLIWEKSHPTAIALCKKRPLKYHEIVSIFHKKQPTYNPQKFKGKPNHYVVCGMGKKHGTQPELNEIKNNNGDYKYPRSVIYFNSVNRTKILHPTQKPVELLEYLIKTYTNEGDTVLDFTMGSGSTGVACVNTGRKFIGIELDDKYFDIAQNRINEAVIEKKQKLF